MGVLIGIDPHKATNAVAAIDERGELLEYAVFSTNRAGVRSLARWGKRFPERRWAVEGAGGLGRFVALRLVAAGELVMDVPAKLSSRARLLATGNARKNDRVDAFHVALAALRGERLAEVGEEEQAEVLRMLSERREDLIKERTRTLNRLHGLLRDLLPGGAPKNLSAEKAARVLRGVRPPACARAAVPHVPGEGWPRTFSETSGALSGSSMNSSAASGRQSKRPPRA
jgi:transposase